LQQTFNTSVGYIEAGQAKPSQAADSGDMFKVVVSYVSSFEIEASQGRKARKEFELFGHRLG